MQVSFRQSGFQAVRAGHRTGEADDARKSRAAHATRDACEAHTAYTTHGAEVTRGNAAGSTRATLPHRLAALLPLALPVLLLALPTLSFAQTAGLPAFTTSPGPNGGTTYSLSVQTMLLLTMLSFLPAMLLMMTSFTRIVIVLSLLRQALGTTTTPPNQVLVGLALFLTLFVMSPVLDKAYNEGYKPFSEGSIPMDQAVSRGVAPFKTFMLRQTRESDLALFARISHAAPMQGPEDVPLSLLVPAFVTSELKTGFTIGFTIFIPFLIIDMVVASVLMSMGMMMVSPATISLPFKLMLFVLVDGWQLLLGSLAQSFV